MTTILRLWVEVVVVVAGLSAAGFVVFNVVVGLLR